MSQHRLGQRPTHLVVTGLAAAVVGATCLTTTGGAAAAAAPECATAYPTADLVRGQAVQGLTVSEGTEPEGFTGTIEGVLDDGIAPGVDMVLAELTSPAVDENGVWAGMSGSPVYADDAQTQLVGAVSYTLQEGSTTLAGITPAAEMLALKADEVATEVRLGPAMTTRLAASGTATRAELASGLRQLPTPIAVSGLTHKRFGQLEGWLDDHGPVTRAAGGSTSAAEADASDIVPGGNVAASLGWGFVTAAATGTVTDVCGADVLAFGHPFGYSGDATYSLHPAEAVTIVPGATFAGFKLANLAAPVGSVTDDRMAGILGRLGAAPTTYDVTSTASYRSRTVSGTTSVTVEELVGDAGLSNAFAVSDRVLDRVGKGGARASWTITGKRRNGAPFRLSHSDVYASSYDIASSPVAEMAMQVYSLLENETEAVTIDGITTRTELDDDATRWQVGPASWRTQGTWKRVTGRAPMVLRAGVTGQVRVELYSRDADSRYVTVPVTATRASVGKAGRLTLQGGFAGDDDFFFYDSSELFLDYYEDEILGGTKPASIPQVLSRLAQEQKNDAIASTFTVRGVPARKRTISLGQVVSGYTVVPVVVRR